MPKRLLLVRSYLVGNTNTPDLGSLLLFFFNGPAKCKTQYNQFSICFMFIIICLNIWQIVKLSPFFRRNSPRSLVRHAKKGIPIGQIISLVVNKLYILHCNFLFFPFVCAVFLSSDTHGTVCSVVRENEFQIYIDLILVSWRFMHFSES